MSKNAYVDYCPNLPALADHIYRTEANFPGRYTPTFLKLFAVCSDYGHQMYTAGTKSGSLVVVGEPLELQRSIGTRQRVKDHGRGLVSNPEEVFSLLHQLGNEDVDGAMLFDREGNLRGVGANIVYNIDDADQREVELVMRVKGKNGLDGTKFPSALCVTGRCEVEAIATSEGKRHASIGMREGRVLRDFIYDPSTGLYGQGVLDAHPQVTPEDGHIRGRMSSGGGGI